METLFDKTNYICHIENLLFYIDQGLKVGRLHRVLQFNQSDWLRPYIEKNTVMRKQASTTFEKNFNKLMSNACFGKTMENKRNRKNIQFVSDEAKASKLTSRPSFKSFQIISENLCSVYFSYRILDGTNQLPSEQPSWTFQNLLCTIFIIKK